MFKVYNQRCNECLFGKNKVVSNQRRKDLLRELEAKDTHFICHKATMRGESVCCKGFFDACSTNLIRIAGRRGMIEEVPLPDAPKQGQGEGMQSLPENWAVPDGFEVVTDVNERLQTGDMLYDPEDEEWITVRAKQAGCYVPEGHTLCRASSKPTVIRVTRRRAAQ